MDGHLAGQFLVPGLAEDVDIVLGCEPFADMVGIAFGAAGGYEVSDQNGYS